LGLDKCRVMRLLLVPWSSLSGPRLRIYRLPINDHAHPDAELSTHKGQTIALKLLDKHAVEKRLTTYNPGRSLRMAVNVEIPNEVAERLLRTLSALGSLDPKILRRKIFDELTEEVTFEKLEQALSIQKLIGG